MMREGATALVLSYAVFLAPAQPTLPSASAPLERVKLSNRDMGLVQPSLLPIQEYSQLNNECKGSIESGKVSFSLIVDSEGRPRNVIIHKFQSNQLDFLALRIAEADKFQPATLNGQPVAVSELIEIGLRACAETTKDKSGRKIEHLRLLSIPEQTLSDFILQSDEALLVPIPDPSSPPSPVEKPGGEVSAPTPFNAVEAEFSDYARKHKIGGTCAFSIVVDAHGLPQDIQLAAAAEKSLLQTSYDAVQKYRFKPAMKNGVPVPARISISITYRLY